MMYGIDGRYAEMMYDVDSGCARMMYSVKEAGGLK